MRVTEKWYKIDFGRNTGNRHCRFNDLIKKNKLQMNSVNI